MKDISWKSLIVGFVLTAGVVIALMAASTLIADYWYEDWFGDWVSNNLDAGVTYQKEEMDKRVSDAAASYYQQPRWVYLMAVFASLGFLIGGFITGKISKSKCALHAGIVSAGVCVLKITILAPIFIASGALGGYLAGRSIPGNDI